MQYSKLYKKIKHWPILCNDNILELMNFIKENWISPKEKDIIIQGGILTYKARNEKEIYLEFYTMGNKKNETIIQALQENTGFWSAFWQKSEKGGHHCFTITFFERKE